jgi:glycosyltransferase involved in cell wall biosynthesis
VSDVHVVVPGGIDDPRRPSGGNVYDRRVCGGLAALGWTVHEDAVPGTWPRADAAARGRLSEVLRRVPDDRTVLVDGLVGCAAPEVVVPEASRLRLVVLVHMPLGEASPEAGPGERAVLSAAASVLTTSEWTRGWLSERYELPKGGVHVALPGVGTADLAPGSVTGGELLCVGAVTAGKGHDVLVAALTEVRDLAWRCVCVGSMDLDPGFAGHVLDQAEAGEIAGRLRFTGPLTDADLDAAYAAADLLVLASRAETYGMVVTEALARGLPVVATAVGGVPEALGAVGDATSPGLLVQPGDPGAVAEALRAWLCDRELRQRLRQRARGRRGTLAGWSHTSSRVSRVLADVTA